MTFIITAVGVGCANTPTAEVAPLVLEEVLTDEAASRRAGFVPGLARHLGHVPEGRAFYVMMPDEDGWMNSNGLFSMPDDDEAPAYLDVPNGVREDFARVLEELQRCSPSRRIILILEFNGSVTAPDSDDENSVSVDVVGPVSAAEFWRLHDLRELYEETVVILEAKQRTS